MPRYTGAAAIRGMLLALLAAGCSASQVPATNDGGDDGETDATFGCLFCSDAADDAPLTIQVKGKIDQICSNADGCHGGLGSGGMSLSPGNEFAPMINVPSYEMPALERVKPGDPAQSYVYRKVACEGGIVGSCMPGSMPDPRLAKLFHDWIEAGAPSQ
jgi:hypothetical protein